MKKSGAFFLRYFLTLTNIKNILFIIFYYIQSDFTIKIGVDIVLHFVQSRILDIVLIEIVFLRKADS